MVTVVGVYRSREAANSGVRELLDVGVDRDHITTLSPGTTDTVKAELDAVPTTEGEAPGMMTAIGAVTGGAVGAAVVEALAAGLIPGGGPVVAIGMLGGVALGALGGGEIGNKAEKALFGPLPEQELFFYEQALRQGRTVSIVAANSDLQADVARGAFAKTGAESIDKARETWWLGLRDVEREKYAGAGGNFDRDEPSFRSGFETALCPANRGKSYDEVRGRLKSKYPALIGNEKLDNGAFERGYKRGRAYWQDVQEEKIHAPW
jgi:hypothetical protein